MSDVGDQRRYYERMIDEIATEHRNQIDQLQAENAALRELVRDLWRFTGAACKKYPRLFDPPTQGPQTVQYNAIDAFEQRMRDLGIEVS